MFSQKINEGEYVYKQDYFALGVMLMKMMTNKYHLQKEFLDDKLKITPQLIKENV